MKFLYIFLILFTATALFSFDEDENAYKVKARVQVKIWINKKVSCTKKVKKRKKGRWVYVKQRTKCNKKVPRKKIIVITNLVSAENKKEAEERFKDICEDRDYKIKKIVKIKRIK